MPSPSRRAKSSADVLARQSPQRERQGALDERPATGRRRPRPRSAGARRAAAARCGRRRRACESPPARPILPEQQRGLERATTRGCQLGQHFRRARPRAGLPARILNSRARPPRAAKRGREAPLPRRLDAGEPERRLPDPRLALQDQPRHARRRPAGRGRHGASGARRPCPTRSTWHLLQPSSIDSRLCRTSAATPT